MTTPKVTLSETQIKRVELVLSKEQIEGVLITCLRKFYPQFRNMPNIKFDFTCDDDGELIDVTVVAERTKTK